MGRPGTEACHRRFYGLGPLLHFCAQREADNLNLCQSSAFALVWGKGPDSYLDSHHLLVDHRAPTRPDARFPSQGLAAWDCMIALLTPTCGQDCLSWGLYYIEAEVSGLPGLHQDPPPQPGHRSPDYFVGFYSQSCSSACLHLANKVDGDTTLPPMMAGATLAGTRVNRPMRLHPCRPPLFQIPKAQPSGSRNAEMEDRIGVIAVCLSRRNPPWSPLKKYGPRREGGTSSP